MHGFERATKDIDVVSDPDPDNLCRLYAALAALGAEPIELADVRPDELPYRLSPEGLAKGGNWFLATRPGRIDAKQFIEGALESPDDYAGLMERALPLETPVGSIRVVSYDDLLRMKYAAGRDVDLIDIRALREARGEFE